MSPTASLGSVRGFIIDLDGTTYIGERLIPGAQEFVSFLAEQKFRWLFVTNNSAASAESYVLKLRRLGLPVTDDQVLTSGQATAMYLSRQRHRRLYVLGTPAFEGELRRAGFQLVDSAPDCVVLGFDKTLTYAKLEAATRFLQRGAAFVATHPDVVCPTEDGYIPDCGAMIALLHAATGMSPTIIGKPESLLVEMALERLHLEATDVAVIGDRLYTDMEMARRAGALGLLVLSGETTPAMVAGGGVEPHVYANLAAIKIAIQSALIASSSG